MAKQKGRDLSAQVGQSVRDSQAAQRLWLTTLGIFKPIIERPVIEPAEVPAWTEEQTAILRQGDLFDSEPAEELEKDSIRFPLQVPMLGA